MDVGDKISTFTMGCTNRLNRCGSWFCSRRRNSSANERPPSPASDIFQGPGPSPGSGSCGDDSQPPPKNCYRLVVLG